MPRRNVTKISKPVVNNNNIPSNSTTIDKDECHKLTLNGYMEEESQALSFEKDLAERSINDMKKYVKTTSHLKEIIKKIFEFKKNSQNDNEINKEDINKFKMKGKLKKKF